MMAANFGMFLPILLVSIISLTQLADYSTSAMMIGYQAPPCSPEKLETAPTRIRNLCEILLTMYQPVQLETYDDKIGRNNLFEALNSGNGPFLGSNVKRQDVDHIFLRFGKRR